MSPTPRLPIAWATVAASLLLAFCRPAPGAAPPAPADAFGDPLPRGAAARLGSLRWRANPVGLAWSPDRKLIATADGYRHTLRLWDAANGRVLRTFHGHRGMVRGVA